jgi:4-oxalocrotonate tautomerase family enzyme
VAAARRSNERNPGSDAVGRAGNDEPMPLIQIDLMEGHDDAVYRELIERCTALYADAVQAPVERFRAQINVVPAAQWGLGGVAAPERVSPLIRIALMEGRTPEVLRALMADMSALVAEILGIGIENTRVFMTEIPVTHWGIGGIPASEVRASEIAARATTTT